MRSRRFEWYRLEIGSGNIGRVVTLVVQMCSVYDGEWQWLVVVGTVGKRGAMRFEWYRFECGSGSIGRVVTG
jgi:hypothetical protein